MTSGLAFRPSKSNSIYGLGSQFSGSYPARSSPPSFSFHVPRSPRARRSLLVLTTHQSTSFLLWLMSAFRAANVSTRLKGRQFHRYGGGHSEEKLPFGHTTPLVRSSDETLPHAEFGKFRSNINANRYPPGAPNRRESVDRRRTRWLSRVNPMAGWWSLSAYPRSYRPVSPSEKLPAFSPHSVSESTGRNRRLCDFPRMMIQRQEKSSRVSSCAMSNN